MSNQRDTIRQSRRWVVKIGSALLTDNGCGLKHELLDVWAGQINALCQRGIEVVIVSSGAVAEGVTRLGWKERPAAVHALQAAAAVGQMGLIQAYETCFQKYGKQTAQILLIHDDISNRNRYLNARTSLTTLMELGVIPIINENDSVATDEIRFGDNDTLAGLVANLIEAELLVLLTDQKGLYTADPRKDDAAEFIESAGADDPKLKSYAADSSHLGRGGMQTKLQAAKIAARSGTHTVIASGYEDNVLLDIADGKNVGTFLSSPEGTLQAKKQWLANQSHVRGTVTLDAGAVKALTEEGRSLLPVGIRSVAGNFKRGELVACLTADGKEIARGLSNFDAEQAQRIIGKPTKEISALLGQIRDDEFIHRDNLILI